MIPEYAEKALQFTAKVRDINEYLAELGVRPPEKLLRRA